jgi:hypothetical protein
MSTSKASYSLSSTIAEIKAFHVTEVHIWVNDNPGDKPNCTDTFTKGGDAAIYKPSELITFADALHKAGITPVFILSPNVQSQAYIDSMVPTVEAAKQVPGVAAVRVELDLEANFTEGWRKSIAQQGKQCQLFATQTEADAALLSMLHTYAPDAPLTVSTTNGNLPAHGPIIAAADEISPQLYDRNWGYDYAVTHHAFAVFNHELAQLPPRPAAHPLAVVPAFSVECSFAHESDEHCSDAEIDDHIRWMVDLNSSDSVKFPGYAIWGSHEARTCTKTLTSRCSVYADNYLRLPVDSRGVAIPSSK